MVLIVSCGLNELAVNIVPALLVFIHSRYFSIRKCAVNALVGITWQEKNGLRLTIRITCFC